MNKVVFKQSSLIWLIAATLTGLLFAGCSVSVPVSRTDVVAAQALQEYIYASGRINLRDDTVNFRMVRHTTQPISDALEKDRQRQEAIRRLGLTSDYKLVIANSKNQVLFERTLANDEHGHEVPRGTKPTSLGFSEFISFPSGAVGLRIQKGSKVLAERNPSANAPSAQVIKPNGGETLDEGVVIEWQGLDRDRDQLKYDVSYSPDGGESWLALALNHPTTSLKLTSTADLPGSDRAKIRVVAADGFLTGADDSDRTFTVPDKPPMVSIINSSADGKPLSVARFSTLVFLGEAFDREDGPLAGSSLVWKSDIDGRLGPGRELSTRSLSSGTHKISFTAADSSGLSTTRTVLVRVTDAPFKLPPSLRELEDLLTNDGFKTRISSELRKQR